MDAYAKQTYASESHDVRAWPGLEMVLDAVRRAGYAPEYAGRATVHQYDIALVSITSDCDWWPYVAERATWRGKPSLIIAGGAGVLNVRPYLNQVDCFVLGRGEVIAPEIIRAHERGERYESPSVIWSDSFDADKTYQISQTSEPYPHQFIMTNGKPFREVSIGCPNKCFFCGYTWHRRYFGDGTYKAGAESMSTGNRERTIMDLLKLPTEKWQDDGPLRIVGLDGMSERLRRKANKPITRDMLRAFFSGLAEIGKPHQVKVYCVIGYPTETEEDWQEFIDDLRTVDSKLKPDKQWSILLHCTPFRAMPATPAATWPMELRDLRGAVSAKLKDPGMKGNVFYQGNRFWCVEGMGTDSLPTVVHSALALRGTEREAENMERIARSSKYWKASRKDKMATLSQMFDLNKLFARHTKQTLPTRYLPCKPKGFTCQNTNQPLMRHA
jgi:hypothetical protein